MAIDGLQNDDALAAVLNDEAQLDCLAREAVCDALAEHKRLGQSVVVWQDGQIVYIPAQDIVVPDGDAFRQ